MQRAVWLSGAIVVKKDSHGSTRSGSATSKESPNRGYCTVPPVRERESCYVHDTSRPSRYIRPKIRCSSGVSNALWPPSPPPSAVALSTTQNTSGRLWSAVVNRRSRFHLAPCSMHRIHSGLHPCPSPMKLQMQ